MILSNLKKKETVTYLSVLIGLVIILLGVIFWQFTEMASMQDMIDYLIENDIEFVKGNFK